jgi:hypothetical protein
MKQKTHTGTKKRIKIIRKLEKKIGKFMFRPEKFMGAEGIDEIIKWAKAGHGRCRK